MKSRNSLFYQMKKDVCRADLNRIFLLRHILLTFLVSVYFSVTVNRSVVWLAVEGEVSQAPNALVLAGYQSRRTLIHTLNSFY